MTEKYKMDTHMHSKASDGLWTPRQVVKEAKERGLEIIALTDHDTTFGVKEAMQAGEEYGIKVIPGIEIDADYSHANVKVKDIELLGLGINLDKIQPFVQQRADARMKSLQRYIQAYNAYLRDAEFQTRNNDKKYPLVDAKELSTEQIITWRNNKDQYENPTPFLSKMDIVNFLLEKFAKPSEEVSKAIKGDRVYSGAFKKEYDFLFGTKEIKPSFYEAIKAVKDADGKSFVAHPGLSKGYENGMMKEWLLPREEWFNPENGFTPLHFMVDLKHHGLDGIELYNYKGSDKNHAEQQDLINEYFDQLAYQLRLGVVHGSDCHGPKGNGPMLGKFGGIGVNPNLTFGAGYFGDEEV